MKIRRLLIAATVTLLTCMQSVTHADAPNIVIILADDLGYGDVHALNPESKIPTPNLDKLAAGGIAFTDAHSPSAVCTPTRYGLLTGRYAWRTRLKRGVLNGYSPPLIEAGRTTIASMLKSRGYRTGAVGKWHLGMTLPMESGQRAKNGAWQGDPGVDYVGVISDGPVNHGFDYFFGVSASLDMPPYVYVRNDRFTMEPTLQQAEVGFPHSVRAGPRSADFVIDEVLDRLTTESIAFIEKSAKDSRPFFLYAPLTAPHTPAQPHERFRGKTGLGEYGDFVAQVDWTVGRILQAIDEAGGAENTVVFFASDNGSMMNRFDHPDRKDHVDNLAIHGYRSDRHQANGPFRGTKADIWEGGHRVPLLVRWPGHVPPGSKNDEPVCLVDLFATCADIVGLEQDPSPAEDSYSLLPMMLGNDAQRGAPVIHHSSGGMFAIRDGKWKLVLGDGSGGWSKPIGEPFAKPYQLFDLSEDIAETTNLADEHPNIVAGLIGEFERIRNGGKGLNESTASRRD